MSAFHPFFAIHAGCFARQNGQAVLVALRIKPDRQLPTLLRTFCLANLLAIKRRGLFIHCAFV